MISSPHALARNASERKLLLDRAAEARGEPAPALVGLHEEFISGPRLDNLLSCHALLVALSTTDDRRDSLVVLNDHEEVGSLSASGAQGTFLQDVLTRLYPDPILRRQVLAGSLFVSVDNAHAVHPNFTARHDPEHLPRLNGGPVIKLNAAGRYATSGLTAALFRRFCRQAGVPCQQFVMRNDLACGSTIGPLTAAALGVAAVDVGVPQLAMHSIRETAGSLDGLYLLHALAGKTDQLVHHGVGTVGGEGQAFDVVAAEDLLRLFGVAAHFGYQLAARLFECTFPALFNKVGNALATSAVGVDDVLGGVAVRVDQVGGDVGKGFGRHGGLLVD